MPLIECRDDRAAEVLLKESASGTHYHLHVSNKLNIESQVTLSRYTHTIDYVAIGVFYQSTTTDVKTKIRTAACFDFWGFVSGNVLRSKSGTSAYVVVKREWCTEQRSGHHESFDAYKGAVIGEYISAAEITLMQFERCIRARLELYRYVSGKYTSAPYEAGSDMHRLLRLEDDESVQLDRQGYTMVLMFVVSHHHWMNNPSENAVFVSSWHRAEAKLFAYRIEHFSPANISQLISALVPFAIDRVSCNDVYSKLKNDDDDYNKSLRDCFPPGGHRYAVPFEAVPSLVGSRDVFVTGGRAYLSDNQLYHIVTHEVKKVNNDNIAERTRTRGQLRGEAWFDDERTLDIYKKKFIPTYIDTIRFYGVGSFDRRGSEHVDDATHETRLDDVLHSSPPCITPMLARGMNLKVREHNKNMDRQDTTNYLLRMGIPAHIFKVKLQIKAERDASVDSTASPWNSLQSSVKFNAKRYNNGVSKVFTPSCFWISKGESKSSLRCPYAEKIKETMPVHDWPLKLADASQAECHKQWQKEAKASPAVHRFPARTPDEYTERLIAQRNGTAAATQVKRKV